jgi:hypothetical protein
VKQTFDGYQIVIKYLLNELFADDQAPVEEAYLSGRSSFGQFRALEEELIEGYFMEKL